MKRDNWMVGEYAVRPAGEPDKCFYCGEKVGSQHKTDCVIRRKTVVVDFTIRAVQTVPELWEPCDVEFFYNEGSWCADNLITELNRRKEELPNRCLCNFTEAKYVREADEKDEEDYGTTFICEAGS